MVKGAGLQNGGPYHCVKEWWFFERCTFGKPADGDALFGNDPPKVEDSLEYAKEMKKENVEIASTPMKIYDARVLQARYPSAGAFYKKYGFCLLKSPTKVKDWNENYLNPLTDIQNLSQRGKTYAPRTL